MNFKKEYRDLEMKVYRALREEIKKTPTKAIKIKLFDYVEIALINDQLVFRDENKHEYSLYSDSNLEDLIDILNDSNLPFNNGDLNFDLEKIKSFDLPITVAKSYANEFDNKYSIELEDANYWYAEEEDRDSDFEKLKSIMPDFSYLNS